MDASRKPEDARSPHHRRRHVHAAALSIGTGVVALLCSACGAASGGGVLARHMLSASNLPPGWHAAHGDGKAAPALSGPCFSAFRRRRPGVSYSLRTFVEGAGTPAAAELIARGSQVDPALAQLRRSMSGCRAATVTLGAQRLPATVRPVALTGSAGGAAAHANAAAFAWSFKLSGIPVTADVVVFTAGSYGGYLDYGAVGTPQPEAVQAFVHAAIVKAQTGAAVRIPASISVASTPVRSVRTTLGAVAYRILGAGPPLVLIMGYGGTMQTWDPRFVDALARHHRVIVFDNAGIGRTAALPAPLTIDAMANQTAAMIGALHLGRVDVLGWSMGSMIAQALAVLHPQLVGRLVLCATYPGNGTTLRPPQRNIEALRSARALTVLMPGDQAGAGRAYLAALGAYPPASAASATIVAAQGRAVDRWWGGADPAGRRAAAIAAPTLIADGSVDRLDPLANSRAVAGLIGRSRLVLYPDAGHAFLFQDEGSFVPVVDSFLRGH